jgi:hypothetical protein
MRIIQSLILAVVALLGMSMAQLRGPGGGGAGGGKLPTSSPTTFPTTSPKQTVRGVVEQLVKGPSCGDRRALPDTVFGSVINTADDRRFFAICEGMSSDAIYNMGEGLGITYSLKKLNSDTSLYAYDVKLAGEKPPGQGGAAGPALVPFRYSGAVPRNPVGLNALNAPPQGWFLDNTKGPFVLNVRSDLSNDCDCAFRQNCRGEVSEQNFLNSGNDDFFIPCSAISKQVVSAIQEAYDNRDNLKVNAIFYNRDASVVNPNPVVRGGSYPETTSLPYFITLA